MRWLFLLLVVLNIFYYIWHQQEAPLRAKEVASLSSYKGSQQGIRLLSEARPAIAASDVLKGRAEGMACFSLSGIGSEEVLLGLQRRLDDMGFQSTPEESGRVGSAGYTLIITSQMDSAATEVALAGLANEFKGLNYKINGCEGLQLPDSLHRMAPAPQ